MRYYSFILEADNSPLGSAASPSGSTSSAPPKPPSPSPSNTTPQQPSNSNPLNNQKEKWNKNAETRWQKFNRTGGNIGAGILGGVGGGILGAGASLIKNTFNGNIIRHPLKTIGNAFKWGAVGTAGGGALSTYTNDQKNKRNIMNSDSYKQNIANMNKPNAPVS